MDNNVLNVEYIKYEQSVEYGNPFVIDKVVKSDDAFSQIMNGFFSSVNGRVKNVRAAEKGDRKMGKIHVIDVVYGFLKDLKPEEFAGKSGEEIKKELKKRADSLLLQLDQEKKDGYFSADYKEGMSAAIIFFNGRFSWIALLS